MTILLRFLFGLICGISSAQAAESSFVFPQGRVDLIHSENSLGLHFKLAEHWHIYWKNSGDSGAAPKFNWNIQGGQLGKTHWPIPERIKVETLTNIGYSNETLFVFDILPTKGVDKIIAELNMEFLICKIECIPYFTDLKKEITAGQSSAEIKKLFSSFAYSGPAPNSLKWTLENVDPQSAVTKLSLPESLAKDIKNLEVFPENGEIFKPENPALNIIDENTYELSLPLQDNVHSDLSGQKFLLVTENQKGQKTAYEISLQKNESPFWTILLWALIGGFILNFMPCVFPVLSIKILSFLGPDKNKHQLRRSGIYYTMGVLVSFVCLGAALLVLRASGEQIGWGFQLQSPFIAAGIAILFFWLGLNFLGVFEIGQSLSYIGAKKTSSSAWGSFLTGVLATIVATPCTAPFMGAALGASLTLPAYATLIVFAGLGFGMALPFLLLAYFPQGLRFLPKPGMWMQRLKEFLAFPLFATVLWLLWVVAQQIQSNGVLFILAIFIAVGFWIWFAKTFRSEKFTQILITIGFILSLAILSALPTEKPTTATTTSSLWMPFTKDSVTADLNQKKAVFIDFTAAWCITCQVNKKAVLHTDDIQNLFKENNVSLYQADWTDRNPLITEALAQFGRNSLPLYVYYPPGSSKAHVLPEILTKTMIENLFNKENPL